MATMRGEGRRTERGRLWVRVHRPLMTSMVAATDMVMAGAVRAVATVAGAVAVEVAVAVAAAAVAAAAAAAAAKKVGVASVAVCWGRSE